MLFCVFGSLSIVISNWKINCEKVAIFSYFLNLAGKLLKMPGDVPAKKIYLFAKIPDPMPGKSGKRDPKKEKSEEREVTTFKSAHIKRIVKKLTKMRVSRDALRSISSAITYILLEILDGGKTNCIAEGKKKMSPKHIKSAITADSELSSLLKNYVIQSGGSNQFSLPELTKKN